MQPKVNKIYCLGRFAQEQQAAHSYKRESSYFFEKK
jgi:hypothetical protein